MNEHGNKGLEGGGGPMTGISKRVEIHCTPTTTRQEEYRQGGKALRESFGGSAR